MASVVGLHAAISPSLVLQTLLLLLGVQVEKCSAASSPSNKDTTGGLCEQGWVHHDNFCYLFRNEYETFAHADLTCSLYHATLAYAYDKSSSAFLNGQIAKGENKKVYGWWYGAQGRGPMAKQLRIWNGTGTERYRGKLPKSTPNLKMASRILPTDGQCFGWRASYGVYSIPCAVNIPFICRGDPKTVSVDAQNDAAHFVNTSQIKGDTGSSDVFWISDYTDKRSHDDAKKACESKSMTLFSIRNTLQSFYFFVQRLDYKFIEPRWVGLKAAKGVFSWDSGVHLEKDLIDPENESYHYFKEGCYILLSDGTFEPIGCRDKNIAPFICARQTSMKNNRFGCLPGWYRGGRSCYKKAKVFTDTSYSKAESICSKVGSHVLSINSATEKIWLLKSSVILSGGGKMWTSLNDRERLGHFRSPDGSTPNISPNDFVLGMDGGKGNCFTMSGYGSAYGDIIYRWRCASTAIPGCQYTLKTGSSCVSGNWKSLNGNCYYLPNVKNASNSQRNAMMASKYMMINKCRADIGVKYDASMKLMPLKLDSKSVYDLYFPANETKGSLLKHSAVFLGLRQTGYHTYSWSDGSLLDWRVFMETAGTGYRGENSTKRCTVLSRYEGGLQIQDCEKDTATAVCEMELKKASSNASVLSPGHLTSYFFICFVFKYLFAQSY